MSRKPEFILRVQIEAKNQEGGAHGHDLEKELCFGNCRNLRHGGPEGELVEKTGKHC